MTAPRCKALRSVAWQCSQEEEESPDAVNRGAGDGGSSAIPLAFEWLSDVFLNSRVFCS